MQSGAEDFYDAVLFTLPLREEGGPRSPSRLRIGYRQVHAHLPEELALAARFFNIPVIWS